MADRFHKFILTLISLMVLFHSISLYAVPKSDSEECNSIEMTEDVDHQETQIQAYEALIPTVQGMAPLVWHFLNEVVLLSEAEYQEMPFQASDENRYLETLFPLIISPNAP
jgi:hypothetical protein